MAIASTTDAGTAAARFLERGFRPFFLAGALWSVVALAAWLARPGLAGRKPAFVYFGGGTPSLLGAGQLTELRARLSAYLATAT